MYSGDVQATPWAIGDVPVIYHPLALAEQGPGGRGLSLGALPTPEFGLLTGVNSTSVERREVESWTKSYAI